MAMEVGMSRVTDFQNKQTEKDIRPGDLINVRWPTGQSGPYEAFYIGDLGVTIYMGPESVRVPKDWVELDYE